MDLNKPVRASSFTSVRLLSPERGYQDEDVTDHDIILMKEPEAEGDVSSYLEHARLLRKEDFLIPVPQFSPG